MEQKLYISIIIFLCVFLTPTSSFSCAKTCTKEKIERKVMKDCCKMNKSAEKQGSCNGKCKNPSCQTLGSNFNLCLPNAIDFKINCCGFINKKSTFIFNETHISSGFYSIWTPPNIS